LLLSVPRQVTFFVAESILISKYFHAKYFEPHFYFTHLRFIFSKSGGILFSRRSQINWLPVVPQAAMAVASRRSRPSLWPDCRRRGTPSAPSTSPTTGRSTGPSSAKCFRFVSQCAPLPDEHQSATILSFCSVPKAQVCGLVVSVPESVGPSYSDQPSVLPIRIP